MDEFVGPRQPADILDRLLAIEGPVGISLDLDRQIVERWLKKEAVWHASTDEERRSITEGNGLPQKLEQRVEAMWALAWTLGLVERLDFDSIYGAELSSPRT